MCTQARHDVMKRERAVYLATTETGYLQPHVEDDGTRVLLEFRHCKLCKSTLSDGTLAAPSELAEAA